MQGINPDAAVLCQAADLERHVPGEVHPDFETTEGDVLEMTSERRCQTITAR